MPARTALTSFTAGRKLTLNGTTYQPGATIPPAVVAGVRRVDALLSRRMIIPNRDPYFRPTLPSKGRPTSVNRKELRAIAVLS